MNNYFITIIFSLFLVSFILPSQAAAVEIGGQGSVLSNAAKEAGYEPKKTDETTFAQQAGRIVKGAMSFLGIIFTVLMVYGGFLWMTARGNEDQVDRAQRIVTNSVIGLILAVGAFSLSNWVVETLLGLL
ncbi:MAG: hypothetical protein ABEJ24_00090 [Candidatus Magasanikbacteria bacterium]